ncbi:hypothetical protein Glove_95g62 [Diversispora epigaea]|uniref:RNase H type-1 domain-containing protein n=1 Tax=Diversispora epigaea TaxID=1348612 RepID=A0A397J7D8_9GLOM|nr:hypothetical protein Glove_95g62 [Diversispora epigaea]
MTEIYAMLNFPKYSQVFKNLIQVTRTIPNSAICHPGMYNLKSISELQNESQINGFIHRLNDTGVVGTSTFICLKDLQLLNWEPTNILINNKVKLNTNDNFSSQILNTAHSLGINFQGPRIQELFQWKGGNLSIKTVLNNDKLYKSSVKSLHRRYLLFLDQIIDTHNNIILEWSMIGVFTNVNRGKQPNWYKLIKNIIVDSTNPPRLSSPCVKDWIGYLDPVESTYIWGHITYKPNHNTDINTTFRIDHYIENQSEQFSLLPCLGCNKSESDTNNNTFCSFSIPSNLVSVAITGLMKLKGAQWKSKLPCNFSSIKNHIYNQYNISITSSFPTIDILQIPEIALIKKFIASQHYSTLLSTALYNNFSTQYLEFYSDGSLTEQGTQHMRMGSAWIQTSGPQLLSTFLCGVSSWPSSSHAEVIAIFTALLIAPSQCKVKINTDSQTCIDTFKYIMTRSLTTRQWLRLNNHVVWLKILETVKSKSLSVILFKVKAHSGVNFNEQVDRLAKNALNLEPIQFNIIDTGPLFTIPTWDIFFVNINTHNFIKQIHKYINLYTWKTWKRLSIQNYYTSIKQSNKRTFLFKLIHNELPTLDRLAIRQPKIYSSFTMCPLCHSTEENIEHLFLCPHNYGIMQSPMQPFHFKSLLKTIIDIQSLRMIYILPLHLLQTILFQILLLSLNLHLVSYPNYVSTIKQVTGSYNKSRDILNTWSNYFRKNFHKNIWRLRYKILIEAENNESNNSSNCNNNSNNINNSFNNDSNNNYNNNNNNCINNSFNIIKGWVSKATEIIGFDQKILRFAGVT